VRQFLKENIRAWDLACRYGGEELTVIVPESSIEEAYGCAEKLRQGIKQLRLEHNQQLLPTITVSLGIGMFPHDGSTIETLIQIADAALYEAKQQGRDRAKLA
ncbi:GGDEF domain-containing protein, partial [Planococcus sp. SIMBA_160]